MDKIELEFKSASTRYRDEVADVMSAVRAGVMLPGVTKSPHYARRIDLREYGHDAFIHYGCRWGEGNSKLELLDTGRKTDAEIFECCEKIAHTDPLSLRVMRFDAAADVPVTVPWVKNHVRVRFKRWGCDYERQQLEYSEDSEKSKMGTVRLQTVYFGRRPNCFRIYNKIDEWMRQYLHATKPRAPLRSFVEHDLDGVSFNPLSFDVLRTLKNEPAEGVTFPEWVQRNYGVDVDEQSTLTRFERQVSASRMPRQLQRKGDDGEPIVDLSCLWQRIPIEDPADPHYFNPFDRLEIVDGGSVKTPRDQGDMEFNDYLKGLGVRALVLELGMQQAYYQANRERNAARDRIFHRYAAFLPTEENDRCGNVREELLSTYHASNAVQFTTRN